MHLTLFTMLVIQHVSGQHLTTVLLKQAADELLEAPFAESRSQGSGLARIEIPEAEDLLIRRLQGELSLRVEDNWRSINDPQRYQILQKKGASKQILKSFQNLKEKMEELEKATNTAAVEDALNSIKLDQEDLRTWLNVWDNLRRKVGQIAQLYTYLKGYVNKFDSTDDRTLEDFASSITQYQSSIKSRSMMTMLENFHEAVSPEDSHERHLFPYFQSILSKSGEHLCSMTQSPHQLLYNLYNIIALTEIKGYAMLQFSYMMLKIYGKGDFTVESEAAKKNFEDQAVEKMKSMLSVLPNMSTQYLKCDPIKHKQGETYLEVTKLLQGFIENEVDMNDRQSCQSECDAYTIAETKGCYQEQFCAQQPKCNGRLFDCQFFNADAWICMGENDEQAQRRYDWVEYEDGTLLGNKGTCKNKVKVDSWWRYVFWHCSYCLCKCEEIGDHSDRYWSLVPAVSDTDNNMAVTGVRFIKRGRVIYPQVEEAKALAEGGIDESTRHWVEPSMVFSNNTNELGNNTKVFMMKYEQRSMDMDTLTAPAGSVLTGIKLRNLGGHLNLEIQVTPVNFTGGNLLSERSTWVANDNTPASDRPRTLVPIIMPDIPTNYHGYSRIDTETDQYIQFDSSSAHKDVSQTTIPFIDAQPVAPQPASWLGGAGLYHKGRVGYGGFVGLKVSTYDFSRHIIPTSKSTPTLRYQFVKAEDV